MPWSPQQRRGPGWPCVSSHLPWPVTRLRGQQPCARATSRRQAGVRGPPGPQWQWGWLQNQPGPPVSSLTTQTEFSWRGRSFVISPWRLPRRLLPRGCRPQWGQAVLPCISGVPAGAPDRGPPCLPWLKDESQNHICLSLQDVLESKNSAIEDLQHELAQVCRYGAPCSGPRPPWRPSRGLPAHAGQPGPPWPAALTPTLTPSH